MSFLRILFSVSMLYYTQARSIRSVENEQPSDEANLDGIIKNLTDCIEQKLEPLLSQLTNDEQNDMRELARSGIAGYVQNMARYISSQAEDNESSDECCDDEYFAYYDDIVTSIEITDTINPPSADDSNSSTNSTETPKDTDEEGSTATAESIAVSSS